MSISGSSARCTTDPVNLLFYKYMHMHPHFKMKSKMANDFLERKASIKPKKTLSPLRFLRDSLRFTSEVVFNYISLINGNAVRFIRT